MRIVHAADTHLGYRQYNSPEREADFRESFLEIVERTIELRPRVFVHAGDLFHHARPSNQDIRLAAEALKKLMDAGIEVLLTPGNHDKRPTRWDIAPHGIMELLGAKVFGLSEDKRKYEVDGVEFWGLPCIRNRDKLRELVSEIRDRARQPAVLVLHQLMFPHVPDPELWPGDIAGFSYVALGDYHIPIVEKNYAYPGSSEVTDAGPEQLAVEERCFYLVELGQGPDFPKIEPQILASPRRFFLLACDAEEASERLAALKDQVRALRKKPVLVARIRADMDWNQDDFYRALAENGLLDAFLRVSSTVERREPRPPRGEVSGGEGPEDILERLFGDKPRHLSLARIMRDAARAAYAEAEASRSARGERKKILERIEAAALEHLSEERHEAEEPASKELFEPPGHEA